MMNHRRAIPPLLLLTLLTISCKKSVADESAATPSRATATDVVRTSESALAPRMIIRDAAEAIANAVRVVEASRGYVAETKQWKESNQTRASAVLRVPSSALSPVLEQLRHVAIRVQSEAVTSQDVSQEHVDLAAQLRNLQ